MFFRRQKTSPKNSQPSRSVESLQETMQRRAQGYIETLQHHYPREFAKLFSEVGQGDLARARLTLRELGSVVDEGYIEAILELLQAQM